MTLRDRIYTAALPVELFEKRIKMEQKTVLTREIEIPSNGKFVIEKIKEVAPGPYFRLTFVEKEHSFILAGGSASEIIEFSHLLTNSIKDFTVETSDTPK